MWTYMGKTGPDQWQEMFPNCGGKRQSPVNIDTSEVIELVAQSPLKFTNFNKIANGNFVNNGNSMQFNPIKSEHYFQSKFLASKNRYKFLQLHFHWGSSNKRGSEHTIDGQQYPLEMHIVHVNEKYANNISLAMEMKDGLAVIGFLYTIGKTENEAFKTVQVSAEALSQNIYHPLPIKTGLVLKDFFDVINGSNFFAYQGSLTTPKCNEVVSWIVMQNPISITESQVNCNTFESLKIL